MPQTPRKVATAVEHDLFSFGVRPLELIARGAAVYFFVVVLVRLSGKRQLGQMSATEFVAVLLISSAVQNSMNGGDNSLVGGLLLATGLVVMSWLVAWLNYRSKPLRMVFEGTPRLLIHRGKPVAENLRKELISINELRTLLRKQGIHRFEDVRTAILESDGSLTIDHANEPVSPAHRSSSEPPLDQTITGL